MFGVHCFKDDACWVLMLRSCCLGVVGLDETVIDQNQRSEGVRLMVVMPSRLPWLALLAAVVLALVVHLQADSALPFWAGMPAWVLMFIVLQAALTLIAAWIARP